MMSAPAINAKLDRRVQAEVTLPDSVVDFTDKTHSLPEPPYIVPSQQHQETTVASPPQDPLTCILSHGIYLGDYVAMSEYSFTCTGSKVLQWSPERHMVEFGSYYEIPERDHLGRRKRVAVVSERLTPELPNPTLPYLPFCTNLDRLIETPATGVGSLSAPINAFPENVRRIICSKVVLGDTGKTYPEVVGLYVLEYELLTPPVVQSPAHSPFPPNPSSSSSFSSFSFSSSLSSSSTSSQSPSSSHTNLRWEANVSYTLDISSAGQEYKTSTTSATGGRPQTKHTLTLNLGIDYPAQSFFALQQPRIHYYDPSSFSMNSVEQSTICCMFQGFPVIKRSLSKRRKLIFKNAKYIRQAQNSVRKARVKAPKKSVLRRILAAISPPTSITPNIFVTVRNSDSSTNSSAGASPSNSGASCLPSSARFDVLASSSSANSSASTSASTSACLSRPPHRSPAVVIRPSLPPPASPQLLPETVSSARVPTAGATSTQTRSCTPISCANTTNPECTSASIWLRVRLPTHGQPDDPYQVEA